jgi:hypothetical protein
MSEPTGWQNNPTPSLPNRAGPNDATVGFPERAGGAGAELPAVPGYEVLAEVGRGGMGVVYRAVQTSLGRVVALKMILQGAQASGEESQRFRTEAEAIARLAHPNIVQIHEVGQWSPTAGGPTRAFFSMEYCGGGTLESRLASGPLQPLEAARLLVVLAGAMHAAHQRGIVHRDLKPANVLFHQEGESSPYSLVRITDFGLAKRLDGAGLAQTASGALLGTPAYMAPEQANGKAVTPATDVYALGALLYQCLTGRPPFLGATMGDVILQVVSSEPVPPRRLMPGLSRDLETICLKCLEKDPARRYGDAQGLADDLHRFLDDRPIVARPIGPIDRGWRWARRNPLAAGLLGMVVVLLVGTAVLSTFQAVRLDQERARAVENWNLAREAGLSLKEAGERLGRAAQQAQEARRQAEEREQEVAQARRRDAGASYLGLIGLAERSWSANQVELADRQLDLCPPTVRRWEWYFLKGLCHAERSSVKGPITQTGQSVLSADGRRVASVCRSTGGGGRVQVTIYTINVWDGRTGVSLFEFAEQFEPPTALAMHPEGKLLAVAQTDHTIHLYDVSGAAAPDEPHFTLQGHAQPIVALAFSIDGKTMVSACRGGEVRSWSTASGQSLGTWVADGGIRALALSATGRVAIGLNGGAVILDQLRGPEAILPSAVWALAGPRYTVADGSFALWAGCSPVLLPAVKSPPLWRRERHHRAIWCLAFTPDGGHLVSGGRTGPHASGSARPARSSR